MNVIKKLLGLDPPPIDDGTVLEYWDGRPAALCVDYKNRGTTWMCYMDTILPIKSGTGVKVYNRSTLFSSKCFTIEYPGGKANVRLDAKTGGKPS